GSSTSLAPWRVFTPMFGVILVTIAAAGCSHRSPADEHADHAMTAGASNTGGTQLLSIPAGARTVGERPAKFPTQCEYGGRAPGEISSPRRVRHDPHGARGQRACMGRLSAAVDQGARRRGRARDLRALHLRARRR